MRVRGAQAQPSLRRTLRVWLLLPLVALVPLAALLIYRLALGTALQALDRALVDTTIALAQMLEVEGGRATLPLAEQTARALRADIVDEIVFAVADGERRVLAGPPPLLADTPAVPAGEWRFLAATFEGKPVRLALHGVPCGARPCTIAVAETLAKRREAERAAVLAALVGAAVLAVPLVALAMLAVGRAMRPLRRAAAEVESLTPERLAPIDTRDVPREVAGFADALNGLLGRLQAAAAAQRAFVADAAHQLRTPLAVMRVEAAQALATPHPGELEPTLVRLHAAAERAARLAQQLLSLARTEGAALDPTLAPQPVDLAQLAAAAAARWLGPSLEADQDLGFELEPAWVLGHPLLLEEAAGNLVDNALQHAGAGAAVTVRTRTSAGWAELEVEDDGRGVAPDELDSLWQRFRRGRDALGTGSGLGLAIVADVARLHRGSATLAAGARGRGLRATLRLPAAPAGRTARKAPGG
ncbi:MAG: sensor histidine kinase [Rubrivivax sp.]